MTYRDSECGTIVDELLLDADLVDACDVRHTLLSLGSLATLPTPTPGAELAAMMAGPHDELTRRRWQRKHRTAVVGFAVVAAMGLGVSGVAAASSGFTRTPTFVDELLGNLAPQWNAAASALPTPDAPKVSTEPAPLVDPAAVPLATETPAVPEPGQAAGPALPAPAPLQQQASDPETTHQAAPAQAKAAPNAAAQAATANPSDAKPAEAKQTEAKPERPTVKPTPSPTEPADAAKPGADAKKPAHTFPSLTDKKSDKELQSFLDKLMQWLKRNER